MKKNLSILVVAGVVVALLTAAFVPRGTGCLAPGSYILAQKNQTIYWWQMNAGLVRRQGQFNLDIGPGSSIDDHINVSVCSLYFSWEQPGSQSEIYRVSVTGHWLTQLTKTADMSELDPYFMADPNHLYFTAYDEGERPNIGLMNRDGTGYSIIAHDTPARSNWPFSWSVYWINYSFAENLRAVAFRPEGNLAAIVTQNGDLNVVTIDPRTLMPTSDPVAIMIGNNLKYATWATIPK